MGLPDTSHLPRGYYFTHRQEFCGNKRKHKSHVYKRNKVRYVCYGKILTKKDVLGKPTKKRAKKSGGIKNLFG